jgi:hypothetical protein
LDCTASMGMVRSRTSNILAATFLIHMCRNRIQGCSSQDILNASRMKGMETAREVPTDLREG